MARAHYYVLHNEHGWRIKLGDDYHGPYVSKASAIQVAVDAARRSHAAGHDAQVLVQGQNGQWQTEWTYGHDPYPPKG